MCSAMCYQTRVNHENKIIYTCFYYVEFFSSGTARPFASDNRALPYLIIGTLGAYPGAFALADRSFELTVRGICRTHTSGNSASAASFFLARLARYYRWHTALALPARDKKRRRLRA